MSETVSSLEERLREKEELVAALTERLEQAAEELDRVHRMGADRGMRINAGGAAAPALFGEEHKALVEDMQRVVQQFEDMQAALTLGRIEDQLVELRELLTSGGFSAGMPPAAHQENGRAHASGPAPALPDRAAPASPTAMWEAMKAQMLGEDADADSAEEGDPHGDAAAGLKHVDVPEVDDSVIPPVDVPDEIDLDSADHDELVEAVEQRDEYISYLIRKLRVATARQTVVPDWEYLQHAPEDLADHLQALEAQLEEKLRFAEVELSMERARLGREAARLKQLEDNAQKAMKRLGLDLGREQPRADVEPEEEQPKNRWLRMLGIGREEDDD